MDPMPPPIPAPAPRRASRRRTRLLLWAVATLTLAAGSPTLFYAVRGTSILTTPAALRAGWIGLSAVCVGLFALLASTPPDAIRLSPRLGKRLILCGSAALAFAAAWWLVPLLSPEPLRHRFDGKIWLLGDSPYLTSPAYAALRARGSRDPEDGPDALDAAAPDQDRTTLTLPAGQAFLVAGRATEYLLPADPTNRLAADPRRADPAAPAADWRALLAGQPWWRRLFTWRLVLAAAYLVTVGELVAWCRHLGKSVWWAALFAWQPLVLIETVGMGHQDVLGVMFLVAGLRRADLGRFRRASISLAASAAVQPVALLALPFVLRQAWQSRRPTDDADAPPRGPMRARRAAVWFAATAAVMLLPLASPRALALAGRRGRAVRLRPAAQRDALRRAAMAVPRPRRPGPRGAGADGRVAPLHCGDAGGGGGGVGPPRPAGDGGLRDAAGGPAAVADVAAVGVDLAAGAGSRTGRPRRLSGNGLGRDGGAGVLDGISVVAGRAGAARRRGGPAARSRDAATQADDRRRAVTANSSL